MKCPFCGYTESKVIDTRPTDEGERIRRRRECLQCGKRFTSYEIVETTPVMVIKKDGSREAFSHDKLLRGVLKSCEKRPVSAADQDKLVDEVVREVFNTLEQEVTSNYIGELVMKGLKQLDEVSYVRFASVYRQFKDINTFMEELKLLLEES